VHSHHGVSASLHSVSSTPSHTDQTDAAISYTDSSPSISSLTPSNTSKSYYKYYCSGVWLINASMYWPVSHYRHSEARKSVTSLRLVVDMLLWQLILTLTHTHTYTHPFYGPFSRTTQVSRYQKGKTNLDFTEARDSEWQWRRLGHMQVCALLQTDNHTSTSPLWFYKPDALPAAQPTASKHWKHWSVNPNAYSNPIPKPCPMQARGHNTPLIWFLILALYILFACLYRMLSHLSFFYTFSLLISSLTYLLLWKYTRCISRLDVVKGD